MWLIPENLTDKYRSFHTPFIGLRARLSQAWAAPTILITVLFLVKLQLLRTNIRGLIDTAENGSIELCIASNQAAAALADAPRQSALLANRLIDNSMSAGVKALLSIVSMIVTGVEQILLFVIEFSIGTWACLTVSFVNIAANEAVNATESVIRFTNETLHSAVDGIEDGLGGLSKLINGATGLIGTVESFVTGSEKQIQKVNLSIESLQKLTISPKINTELEELRGHIPTYDGVKTTLEDTVSIPFNLVKSRIKSSNITFHVSDLTAPKVQATPVCNIPNIVRFYAKCDQAASTAVDILTAILCVVIAVLILYNASLEIKKWDRISDAASNIVPSCSGKNELQAEIQSMSIISRATAPPVSRVMDKTLHWARGTAVNSQPLYSWYIQYITYRPALNALFGGLIMLILSLFEYIVVRVVSNEANKLSKSLASETNQTMSALRTEMAVWESSTNLQIRQLQDQVNTEVLGWVSTSTLAINNTLTKFMTSMNGELEHAFGKTPLYKPLSVVVDCLIGNKVEKVERGLTWVHKKAHVSLPLLSVVNDTSLFNPNQTQAAFSKFDNTLPKITNTLYSQILYEAIVGFVFVGVWIFFAIAGMIYVHTQNKDNTKDEECTKEEEYIREEDNRFPAPAAYRETQIFTGPNRKPRLRAHSIATVHYGQWHSTIDSYSKSP